MVAQVDRVFAYSPEVDVAKPLKDKPLENSSPRPKGKVVRKNAYGLWEEIAFEPYQQVAKKERAQYRLHVDEDEANLITSIDNNGGHAPVIDFDIPIEVYPSSQLGHNHLYINKAIRWDQYVQLLRALQNAGLVEQGYIDASIDKGHTAVRPPGVVKQNAPSGVEVLKENALLRKENYRLRQELDEYKKQQAPAQAEENAA